MVLDNRVALRHQHLQFVSQGTVGSSDSPVLNLLSVITNTLYTVDIPLMSVSHPYLSPAATPDNPMASPAGGGGGAAVHNQPQAMVAGSPEQLRADIERMLLKISQDLYELEVCAGDVALGQEDRVPMYM
jgi:hypothetical protein